jgi:hypothetical protein
VGTTSLWGKGKLRGGRTSRKIQQAIEMEPRIPERASWAVSGIAVAADTTMVVL